MKHLKKFNESLKVVDPMMDVIEFREMFKDKLKRYNTEFTKWHIGGNLENLLINIH